MSSVNNSNGRSSNTLLMPLYPTALKILLLNSCSTTRQAFSITVGDQWDMKHWSQNNITALIPRVPTSPWEKKKKKKTFLLTKSHHFGYTLSENLIPWFQQKDNSIMHIFHKAPLKRSEFSEEYHAFWNLKVKDKKLPEYMILTIIYYSYLSWT